MEKSVKSWMKNWVDLIKNQSLNKPQEEWVELECLPGVMFKGLRVESVGSEIATDENKLSINWVYSDIDFVTEKKQVEDEKDGWFRSDRPFNEYPLGTLASCGCMPSWCKTPAGWVQEGRVLSMPMPGAGWDGFVKLPKSE